MGTLGDEFVAAVRAKTSAITAADLQLMECMETVFDLGARDEEDAAFEELDKKLKRERKLLQLKQEKEAAAELEALKKGVEEELKETAMEEKESIPVESGSESTN